MTPTTPTNADGSPRVVLNAVVGRLLCAVGRHDWRSDGGNVESDTGTITLIWWQCARCAESKLRYISK